jgi:hypothetical protein
MLGQRDRDAAHGGVGRIHVSALHRRVLQVSISAYVDLYEINIFIYIAYIH